MNNSSPVVTVTRSTLGEPAAQPETPATEGSEAAGTEEGTPAVEKPVESKPEPLDLAKRFEQASRQQAHASKLVAQAQAQVAEVNQKMATFEKTSAEKLAKLDAEIAEFEADPVTYLTKKGKDPVAVARRFAKPKTDEEREIEAVKRRLDEREEREKKDAADAEARKLEADQRAEHHRRMVKFVGDINPKECPNLVKLYEAHEIPALVRAMLDGPANPAEPYGLTTMQAFQKKHGRSPSNAEIRRALEVEAQVRATRIGTTPGQPNGAPPGDGSQESQGSTQSASAGSAPTGISNQHGSVSGPSGKKKLSLEERRRLARKDLTDSLEAEASERRSDD